MAYIFRSKFLIFVAFFAVSIAYADDRLEKELALKRLSGQQGVVSNQERARVNHRDRMRAEWAKIYQPSDECKRDSSSMRCANEHAVAFNRFLQKFGEFPPRF